MEVERLSSLSGSALAAALGSALETPGLYVFSDLLELPNVRALESGPHGPVYQLLRLFAYGTYGDYVSRSASLPALTPAQRTKLRQLSVVSLASSRRRRLPYALLLQQLDMQNVRQLEDLLIEAVHGGLITARLDQRHQTLEVESSVGRDLSPSATPAVLRTMQDWCHGCDQLLLDIQGQVTRANHSRRKHLQREAEVNRVNELHRKLKVNEVNEVNEQQRKLKANSSSSPPPCSSSIGQRYAGPAYARGGGGYASSNQDEDGPWGDLPPTAFSQEVNKHGKKSSKAKGTSGKIWSKVLKTFKRQPDTSPVGDEGETLTSPVHYNPEP